MKQIINLCFIILVFMHTSCSKKSSTGAFLTKTELNKISECKKNKCNIDSIYSTIGFPILVEENKGYFIGTQYSQFMFFKPTVAKIEIIEFILNANNELINFNIINDSFDNKFRSSAYLTKKYHDQETIKQKFLKNVRKFTTKESDKPKARLK